MKSSIFSRMAIGMMAAAQILVSCSKDSNEPDQPTYDNLKLSTDQPFEVEVGGSVAFTIDAGSGEYTVASNHEDIAKATLTEKKVSIQAVAVGETQIVVTDTKSKQTATVGVKVLKETPPVQVEGSTNLSRKVVLNTTLTLTITAGSGNYVAGVEGNKVTARVEGNQLHITANAEGYDKITVIDAKTNKTATISVEVWVIPDIKLSHTEIPVETNRTAVVQITTGSGEYEIATPPNATHVTATLAAATITLTATAAAGETALEVRDTQTGKTATLTIKVVPPSTTHNIAAGEPVYMLLTTQKAVGEKIAIYVKAEAADEDNLWIDLNNNGTKDTDEKLEVKKGVQYTLGVQHIAIYGKVTHLVLRKNSLTFLDVSKNTDLRILDVNGNSLTALDVSKNTNLKELMVETNSLTTLYVGNNKRLQRLICSGNKLTNLDVSNNEWLYELSISWMPNLTLEISQKTPLSILHCIGNNYDKAAMERIINLLYDRKEKPTKGTFYGWWFETDANYKSNELKALLKAKGWTPMHNVGAGWAEWQ